MKLPDWIEEVEKRASSATEGPWVSFVEGRDHQSGSSFIRTSGNDIELCGATIEDQDFIAHARHDVVALIREIRRLNLLLGDRNE